MIKRIPWALIQWAVFGAIKAALVIIGLPAVALGLVADGARRTPKMWQLWGRVQDIPNWWYVSHEPNRFWKWWWMAVRNPVQGMANWFDFDDTFRQWGYSGDMEQAQGFAWRWRTQGWKDGLRIVWGKPRDKGKREFWIGFQAGSVDPGFTMQLRPF